jgi:hypothetical protein
MFQVTFSHLNVCGDLQTFFYQGIRCRGDVERGGRAPLLNNVLERDALWLHEDLHQVASIVSLKQSSSMMLV